MLSSDLIQQNLRAKIDHLNSQLASTEKEVISLHEELDLSHSSITALQQEKHDLNEQLWEETCKNETLEMRLVNLEKAHKTQISKLNQKIVELEEYRSVYNKSMEANAVRGSIDSQSSAINALHVTVNSLNQTVNEVCSLGFLLPVQLPLARNKTHRISREARDANQNHLTMRTRNHTTLADQPETHGRE